MPNARNAQRKAIHMLQRSSHTPTQEIKHTRSSPRKRVKVGWSRCLVKISASCSCVGTWIKVIFPFSTLSLRKWYLTSMCLVLEWSTEFFATLMALVLSHWSGTWVYSSPKSLMVYEIQRSLEQTLAVATYSASVVDWATLDCLRED
jgi:K+-sensing histidine kinase KdpD